MQIMAYGARHVLLKAIDNLKLSYKSRQLLKHSKQSKPKKIIKIPKSQISNSLYYNKPNKSNKLNQSHRKASMSSVTSKASIQTSHTYCAADLQKENNDTIIDDNWENLNTMAKHGVVDASQYLKQVTFIVYYVYN